MCVWVCVGVLDVLLGVFRSCECSLDVICVVLVDIH